MTGAQAPQNDETERSVEQFVAENTDLLTRVLISGDTEAQAWALTLLANAEPAADIDAVREQLDKLVQERNA